MTKPIAVIVPVYGQPHLTAAVLQDLEREASDVDVFVVDNGGDWEPSGFERVIRTGVNLRWVGGCNVGLVAASEYPYEHFLLLNNDVRLSPDFCRNLVRASVRTGSDVVAAHYDEQSWPHQYLDGGEAALYEPALIDSPAPLVDGNDMLISRQAVESVGLLNSSLFARSGWGADLDYALRARRAGMHLSITQSAYLNHFVGGSDGERDRSFFVAAYTEMCHGLRLKHGADWEQQLWQGFEPIKNIEGEFAALLAAED